MSRSLRFALFFVVALVALSFLPIFPEQMVMRSYMMDGSESIQHVWIGSSLYGAWNAPGLWRAALLGLAGLYALAVAAGGLRVWDRMDAR